jgi:hypothetical protein
MLQRLRRLGRAVPAQKAPEGPSNESLKHLRPLAHTRPRRETGWLVTRRAGVVADSAQPKEPLLGLRHPPRFPVLVV